MVFSIGVCLVVRYVSINQVRRQRCTNDWRILEGEDAVDWQRGIKHPTKLSLIIIQTTCGGQEDVVRSLIFVPNLRPKA